MKRPLTPAAAKFLALGVLSPSKREKSRQEVVELQTVKLQTKERNKDMNLVIKQRRFVQGLKKLSIVLMLGVFLAACSSEVPETLESQAKWAVPHYNPNGSLSGHIHWLDQELHDEIVDIIIAKGGVPSPSNVDSVYDCLDKPSWWPGCGRF
jgi:hypothetical protein